MQKVVWTLAALALMCGPAAAQDVNEPTPQQMAPMSTANTLDKALIANERKVNDAVAKGDKNAFMSLVSPNAWSADSNGFMKISDFTAAFDQIKITNWSISDEKVSWIDANNAVVTYKWNGAGTFQGQAMAPATYASSLWTKKGDKWVIAFHQESDVKK